MPHRFTHQRQSLPTYPVNTYLHTTPILEPPSHFYSQFWNGSAPIWNRTIKTSHPSACLNDQEHAHSSHSAYRSCHRESCDTFTTVTFHSHYLMSMWTVCSCLWYSAALFLSVASYIQYIYITLHFASTFLPCSVFFLVLCFCRQQGHHHRGGGHLW
jgi:hypothetical protein